MAAQTGSSATGKVTAGQEPLEGVLVSAKKDGSTITVTVVSDKDGRYSFPAARLEPGQYSLRIRAIGYELDDSDPVTIAADKTATADLALAQDRRYRLAAYQRRMARQHARHRRAERAICSIASAATRSSAR